MNFIADIEIDLPRAEVLQKLINVDNFKYWQEGFKSAEHISGIPGEFGAKMKLTYLFGKQKKVWIETITKRDLPFQIHANYSDNSLINFQRNYFNESPEGVTKWISNNEFIPISFKMRLFVILMPGLFKKQILNQMINFKNFAEQRQTMLNATD